MLNGRVDQLLMIRLASADQLGLYAVAVTLASAPSMVVGTLADAIFPRIAAGENHLVARSCRISLLATVLSGIGVAAVAYPVLRFVFGPDFRAATTMVLILVVAQVPAAVNRVLGFSLRSAGFPGKVSIGEVIGLSVTVPGVIVLVPPLGGVGAAIVSAAAYGTISTYLLYQARRAFGGSLSDYVAVGASDFSEIAHQLGRRLAVFGRRAGVARG
jgi:O-antigen/teichoic acid export membrane protein